MLRLGLILLLAPFFSTLFAQNLTGKWKGYFIPNNDPTATNYLYELEIKENSNHQLTAITYTTFMNQFSAKAFAKGQHSINTQMVNIMETSFDQLKINTNLQACLMQNYLTYSNIEGYEILEGSYVSNNIDGSKNCGGGKIYLEKANAIVKIIEYKKEKSKTRNLKPAKATIPENTIATLSSKQTKLIAANNPSKQGIQSKSSLKTTLIKEANASTPPSLVNKQEEENFKPNEFTAVSKNQVTENSNLMKAPAAKEQVTKEAPTINNRIEEINTEQPKLTGNLQSIPWVLVGRENKLVKRIITNNKIFTLDFYDNGTIDNDTIMVFDNKRLINSKQRLSYKSIHLEFEFTDTQNEHEVIVVAQNMGTVPPNTALMVFKEGKNRQDFFITTTNKINAKLVVVYQAPTTD